MLAKWFADAGCAIELHAYRCVTSTERQFHPLILPFFVFLRVLRVFVTRF
jgi:hypothetical protein